MFFHHFDLSAEVANRRMHEEAVFVLDVRNEEEFQEGHIPQAHLIPVQQLEEHLNCLPKDQPIFIYCRSGQRAQAAKKKLLHAGYQDVYNIGGVLQWPYELTQ